MSLRVLKRPVGYDAEFKESEHPREKSGTEKGGQFTAGGTSGGEKSDGQENASKLSPERKQAVLSYVDVEGSELNDAIRSHTTTPEQQQTMKNLDEAIAASKAPDDMTVYRGVPGDIGRKQLGAIKKALDIYGKKRTFSIEISGYPSAATNAETARKYASGEEGFGAKGGSGVVYEIVVPKGAPALSISESLPDERGDSDEIVLPRNQTYTVLGIKGNTIQLAAPKPPKDSAKDAEFKESEHPRGQSGTEKGGQFVAKGEGGGRATHLPTKVHEGQLKTHEGAELPEHIKALKIPPAWTDITYSPDPESDLLATGKDKKGRLQAIYSDTFSAKQAAAKFARIDELSKKFDSIFAQNEKARKSDDPKTKDAADCTRLIMMTGIRPGSESDTGAEKQAYGATTLLGKHVVAGAKGVHLRFTGKKGVSLDIPVLDPETASMLVERKAKAGDKGQLFGISEKNLLDHVHSFDGGGFKTKDFRTLLGTSTAMREVGKAKAPPKNEKEYKKAVRTVAQTVSKILGNTPTVALQSYINPVVFAQWQIAKAA